MKATFHARMDMIKERNGMGLTEVETMRKGWQEQGRTKQKTSL